MYFFTADYMMYEYFNASLWGKIDHEGDDFFAELNTLYKYQNLVDTYCAQIYAWVLISLHEPPPPNCHLTLSACWGFGLNLCCLDSECLTEGLRPSDGGYCPSNRCIYFWSQAPMATRNNDTDFSLSLVFLGRRMHVQITSSSCWNDHFSCTWRSEFSFGVTGADVNSHPASDNFKGYSRW